MRRVQRDGQFVVGVDPVSVDAESAAAEPLKVRTKGWTEGWTDGWTASPPLSPRTAPPHLSFQLAYDPDYPPPTYVTREGAGSRGRYLIDRVRRGWSRPRGKRVRAHQGRMQSGAAAMSYGSSSKPATC